MAPTQGGGPPDPRDPRESATTSHGTVEPQPLDLTANVPDEQMYTWESQAAQYPPNGEPGISYFRGDVTDKVHVDCLLYRDEAGELVGILNRYPQAIPPFEREGAQNVWVRPDRRRQGIGSALISEAARRWMRVLTDPNPPAPNLTESGTQLVQAVIEDRSIGHLLPASRNVVYDAWWDAEGMYEWMCPRPAFPTHIEIDPQVDGQFRMNVDHEGSELTVTGRYTVFERPRGLVFTWRSSSWEPSDPESMVIVQLEPNGKGQTLMTIRHLRLPADRREEYKSGWTLVAAQLEEYLARR